MTLVAPPPPILGPAAAASPLPWAYGPLVEITLQPGTRTLVVQDPGLIRTMLTDLGPSLDKGRFFEKVGQLLGDSVVTAAGQSHVRKRRRLQPAFGRERIARYVDTMRGETDATVDGWTPGRPLDVREAMVGLSLDMLAKTVFSGSLDEAAFRRLRPDLSVVMNGVGARVILPDWVERLPLPANRRFSAARDAVRATVDRAVREQGTGADDLPPPVAPTPLGSPPPPPTDAVTTGAPRGPADEYGNTSAPWVPHVRRPGTGRFGGHVVIASNVRRERWRPA